MTKTKAFALACAAAILSAVVSGQSDLLTFEDIQALDEYSFEWKMHSVNAQNNITTWMYNSKTGKVYRVFTECGTSDAGANGCLIALPVWTGDRLGDYAPYPGGVTSGPEL